MGFLARARSTMRSLGTVDTLIYTCAWCLHRIAGRRARLVSYHIVAQPVADTPRLPPARGKSIEVRQLDPATIRVLDFPRPAEVIEFRLGQGATCFGAFHGDSMVGFLWLIMPAYDEDEVRCRFEPLPEGECAWDFDVYVDPEHRLGPTFLRLWDTADSWLRTQGVRWTMSRISSLNPGSVRSHRRLGARFVGRALFLRLGRLQLMVSTMRPKLHVSTNSNYIPVLGVNSPKLQNNQ